MEAFYSKYSSEQFDQVLSKAENSVQDSGGEMVGELILSGFPTSDNQAANKGYVDKKALQLSDNIRAVSEAAETAREMAAGANDAVDQLSGEVVKTVNGTAPDANGNVNVMVSVDRPVQIQTDYEQNDSAQLDYIKNRPFYKISSTVIAQAENFAFEDGVYNFSAAAELVDGDMYQVIYDGVLYELEAFDVDGYVMLGNIHFYTSMLNGGYETIEVLEFTEPFLIGCIAADAFMLQRMDMEEEPEGTTHSITIIKPEVQPISPIYANNLPYIKTVNGLAPGPSGNVKLPAASAERRGLVKIGDGLQMTEDVLSVKPEGVYELIETIVIEEEAMLSRDAEPDGTAYQFKALLLEFETTAANNVGFAICAYFDNMDSDYLSAWQTALSNNTTKRYGWFEFFGERGYWNSRYVQFGSAGIYNQNNKPRLSYGVEQYPYITKFDTSGALSVGTTVRIWGVRA